MCRDTPRDWQLDFLFFPCFDAVQFFFAHPVFLSHIPQHSRPVSSPPGRPASSLWLARARIDHRIGRPQSTRERMAFAKRQRGNKRGMREGAGGE